MRRAHVELKPGWLRQDVERAAARVKEWQGMTDKIHPVVEAAARSMCGASFKRQFKNITDVDVTEHCESGKPAAWTLWVDDALAALQAFEPLLIDAHAAGAVGMAHAHAATEWTGTGKEYARRIITSLTKGHDGNG